jgi:hypothetical protein
MIANFLAVGVLLSASAGMIAVAAIAAAPAYADWKPIK